MLEEVNGMNRSIPAATHKNQRRCVVCRRLANKSEFWRIVRTFPDRTVALEIGMGRSAYLCKTEVCLKSAEKKDRLSRSLRAPVPSMLYQKLHQSLIIEPARLCSEDATIEIGIL
jgi:uncharacterized protein